MHVHRSQSSVFRRVLALVAAKESIQGSLFLSKATSVVVRTSKGGCGSAGEAGMSLFLHVPVHLAVCCCRLLFLWVRVVASATAYSQIMKCFSLACSNARGVSIEKFYCASTAATGHQTFEQMRTKSRLSLFMTNIPGWPTYLRIDEWFRPKVTKTRAQLYAESAEEKSGSSV